MKGKELETIPLFTDLSAEEAETVNGAHGSYYYYQLVGYQPVYRRRYRRYRHRRHHYGYYYRRPRYYSSYRTVYHSSCW